MGVVFGNEVVVADRWSKGDVYQPGGGGGGLV